VGNSNERAKIPGGERPPASRSLIVAFRVLLLLLAAGALVAAAVITVRDHTGGDSGTRYACPMHPDVRAAARGECPICGMALEPVGHDAPMPSREAPGMADVAAVENVRKHNIIDFVRKRSLLFSDRELRGPAWVERDGTITAVFYRDQVAALRADEPGSFTLTQAPDTTVAVRRTADPEVRWDQSTSRLRFRPDAAPSNPSSLAAPRDQSCPEAPRRGERALERTPTAGLQPGQVGWLELAPRPRQVLTVPASAIVQSPEGPYVLASLGGFKLEKRPIEIGETFLKEGFAVVLSGLHVNERVVARATFFLDADRRLDTQAGEMVWVTP